eukprot:6025100-Amphidinium_carterae.1
MVCVHFGSARTSATLAALESNHKTTDKQTQIQDLYCDALDLSEPPKPQNNLNRSKSSFICIRVGDSLCGRTARTAELDERFKSALERIEKDMALKTHVDLRQRSSHITSSADLLPSFMHRASEGHMLYQMIGRTSPEDTVACRDRGKMLTETSCGVGCMLAQHSLLRMGRIKADHEERTVFSACSNVDTLDH